MADNATKFNIILVPPSHYPKIELELSRRLSLDGDNGMPVGFDLNIVGEAQFNIDYDGLIKLSHGEVRLKLHKKC